ncbi:mechanosensitive ion channel family protein [Marivirga sp.]|uniref:mechanosensitive ion channel family protein n=1 Tax=Marivirga sp. TaxID=2018662 RepID=UPI002D7E9D02|nr:mechanosensitive ion channel domain-containing protein [Marivirga sp.]HET8859088.1 mechanosensitive ion channel domain-containing protein [Marivirga sp.]
MKFGQIKLMLLMLFGLNTIFIVQAQDTTLTQKLESSVKKPKTETQAVKSKKENVLKPVIKVDSSKLQIDSLKDDKKVNITSEQEFDADTLIIKTEKEQEADGFEENKIEELSNLISNGNIFYTVVFFLFGFIVIKVISFILNALAERSTKYRIAFKGSIPIVKIVGWVIVISLIIVVIYQPSVASMLAVSASIGVAIGFASQDILKNIFGGIVILLDRPFVSGDKIEVDKYYGEVVEIGLRSTRIVTPDDSLVSVPNAVMMNSSLSNSNAGEPNCQVVSEIYLPLTIDPIKTREIATQAATISKYIYLGKPITVHFFNEVNNHHSYYKMRVKAYVMDIRDEFQFKSDMTELIITELVKVGVLDGKF